MKRADSPFFVIVLLVMGLLGALVGCGVEAPGAKPVDGTPTSTAAGSTTKAGGTTASSDSPAIATAMPSDAPATATATPTATQSDLPLEATPLVIPKWPPTDEMRQEIVSIVLEDAEVQRMLDGKRYEVLSVGPDVDEKYGPCAVLDVPPHTIPCARIILYDYSTPTGISVLMNLHTHEIVDRRVAPDRYPPSISEDALPAVASIIANTPGLEGAEIEGVAKGKQVGGFPGSECGLVSPKHPCYPVRVVKPDGIFHDVAFDVVEMRVVWISAALDSQGRHLEEK